MMKINRIQASRFALFLFGLMVLAPFAGWAQDFTVSTDGYIHYYKLQLKAGGTHYMVPEGVRNSGASWTHVTTYNVEGDYNVWYFMSADDGFYYIVNALSGKYVKCKSDAGTAQVSDAMTTEDLPTSGDLSQFMYKWETLTGSYDGYCAIIAKKQQNDTYKYVNKSQGASSNNSMCLWNTTATDGSCWKSVSTTFSCPPPAISYENGMITLTPANAGLKIRYTTDGSEPTSSSTLYDAPFEWDGTSQVKAVAYRCNDLSDKSGVVSIAYVSSGNDITNMYGYYILNSNFTMGGSVIGTEENPFKGTIDGNNVTIPSASHPFFGYVKDATIKDLFIYNANISAAGQVGAIANVAQGATRIYNCGILGGTVGSTGTSTANNATDCCGGLVGLLDGEARVVYCFNYANITGGNRVGGIVGYNNEATTSEYLKTMVFGCMFYGDITAGENKAPIYNGKIINNKDNKGVSNYNYCRAEASYVTNRLINTSNCALLAETRFLQRFEFFRHNLNGHRELAAWWATGDVANKDEMMKWVMLPDSIGSGHPYPILKPWGKYPSVVNIDAEHAQENQPRNKGGKLGTLTVNIEMGNGGAQFAYPDGAEITTTQLTLNITDKDPDHFNFNYYKVQLPYYNDVGTKNYTGNRVVTGWKIVKINGSTEGTGTFSTGEDAPAYNFADRNCSNKDLYSKSGRVFNQGAYFDVPEGVTSITIQPYWAKCVYVADNYADVVYNNNMNTGYPVPNVGSGQIFANSTSYDINGDDQKVYTNTLNSNGTINHNAIANAIASTALNPNSSHTVYDYAIVLVGNCHKYNAVEKENKPYTIMSADFDGDNEPDYSFIFSFNGRTPFHPVRYDFVNLIGLGMAQKSTSSTGSYNFGILQPKFWFEVTNTALFRVTQFEYDRYDRIAAPLIVQGGVMEQWVSGQSNGAANRTTYFHVGGNVWFKEFHRGTHQDQTYTSKHPPVSVTGGDYDKFYLTGLYHGGVANFDDNAECYINGGHFGELAGAGMEGIGTSSDKGNITWQIDNADIKAFYGGGLNAARTVKGNITITISNSHVDLFCGGPKFGDMDTGKTVTTTATNCTFGTYFGAGYGGNSYSRYPPKNYSNNITNIDWNKWIRGEQNAGDGFGGYKQEYNATRGGVSTQFDYQFIPLSDNTTNVARLFVDYIKFSLAKTHTVTSTLTNCTITNNFYGGGSLGEVDGSATSRLTDCTVLGNAFGAGFSASLPTVEVDSINGFRIEPYYYTDYGTYRTGVHGATTTFKWVHSSTTVNSTATAINTDNKELYTNEDLDVLGAVKQATITIDGNSTVRGHVFGGGDESSVGDGGTLVIIKDHAKVYGNIYGGGNMGDVAGDTKVIVNGQ